MHKIRFFQTLLGVILVAFGAIVMVGWLTRMPALLHWHFGQVATVFSAALSFALTGIALMRAAWRPNVATRTPAFLGAALIALAALSMLGTLLGADWLPAMARLHDWLPDGNPQPGRMAFNAAGGFMLCGLALILMQRAPRRWTGMAIQIATFAVLTIGLTGLVSHSLPLDLLFASIPMPPMAISTALAMIVAAVGLWLGWHQTHWYQQGTTIRADDHLGFVGAAILVVIALTTGVAGFAGHVESLERSLGDKLWTTLDSRIAMFNGAVEHAIVHAVDTAERPDLRPPVLALSLDAARSKERTRLHGVARSILHAGFSGMLIFDTRGNELFRAGDLLGRAEIEKDLGRALPATLMWEGGFHLRTQVLIFHQGVLIGTLLLEQALTQLDSGFFEIARLGKSGEMNLCFAEHEQLICFPQPSSQVARVVPRQGKNGQPLPMSLAVDGRRGSYHGVDYFGNSVMAAYAPVTDSGFGMSVKQGADELFQPIRQQILSGAPLLLLFVALGAWLLRSQVKPLATRLLMSEAEARDMAREAKEKERHVRAVVDNVGEGILTFDQQGRIGAFNAAASTIFGYTPEEAIGRRVGMLMPVDARARFEEELRRYPQNAGRGSIGTGSVETTGLRKDGSMFALEATVNEIETGRGRLFVGIVRDITESKQAQAALFREKEHLRVTLNSIGDAVITTDTAGVVTYLNPVAANMTGWTNAEAVGLPLEDVFHIVDEKTGEPALDPVEEVLQSRQAAGVAEGALLVHRVSGVRCPIEDSAAPILDADGAIIGVVLAFRDVGQARRMAEEMSYQATHDALTGLINRREFERRLALSLQSSRLEHKEHSLLYLDLDQFKVVNDTAGHVAGDELLRQVTSALGLKLRQSDTLARLGGDEFGVLLESCGAAPALQIADNLRQTIADYRFVWEDKIFVVGVSIGLVTYGNGGTTLEDVMRMADAACYVAKEKGRNRVQVYSPDDKDLAQRHGEMGWMGRIKSALEQDRFVLYEQTIMDIGAEEGDDKRGGRHRELLLRMIDEDGRLIPPMAFIPAAERYGLMPLIDRWVIRTAFARHATAHEGEQDICAINISGASICDPHFLDFVLEQFRLYPAPPASICFEITETVAIANLAEATAFIQRLKAIGCRFALDDFGAGMSSFTYLKHFPVDYLKIDGSFVKDMLDDPIDHVMVQSINHIGQAMNIRTIAEFVENDRILEALRSMGVNFAQGYGIEKPKPMSKGLPESGAPDRDRD